MRVLPLAAAVRFVIYSSPKTNQVWYWRAPIGPWAEETPAAGAAPTGAASGQAQVLIDEQDLEPLGLALDHSRNGLYVACKGTNEIRRYQLLETSSGSLESSVKTLQVEAPANGVVIVDNVQVRWLAVDAIGNLFFSREAENAIVKIDAADLIQPGSSSFLEGNKGHPGTYKALDTPLDIAAEKSMLYSGANVPSVSGPGGVAVDNFRVFWTNKIDGTQAGSVVQGFEIKPQANPTKVTPIAANSNKVMGVCLSANNVYFTDENGLYGVKKYGGAIATVSTRMHAPRGCAWDGDGTIYVADFDTGEDGNAEPKPALYSFPGNMKSLSPQKLSVAYDTKNVMTEPFGLAVFSTGTDGAFALALGVSLLAMFV